MSRVVSDIGFKTPDCSLICCNVPVFISHKTYQRLIVSTELISSFIFPSLSLSLSFSRFPFPAQIRRQPFRHCNNARLAYRASLSSPFFVLFSGGSISSPTGFNRGKETAQKKKLPADRYSPPRRTRKSFFLIQPTRQDRDENQRIFNRSIKQSLVSLTAFTG